MFFFAKIAAFLLGAAALAAASLADAQPRRNPDGQAAVSVQSPQFFVTSAAQLNLLLLQSSQLAFERAQSQAVKSLANLMLEDHRRMQSRLRQIAEGANLKMPQELDQEHRAKLDALQKTAKGGDFDKAWLDLQRQVQHDSLQLHAAYAKKGDHKDLKDMADMSETVLRQHLRRIQNLPSQ